MMDNTIKTEMSELESCCPGPGLQAARPFLQRVYPISISDEQYDNDRMSELSSAPRLSSAPPACHPHPPPVILSLRRILRF